MEFSRLNAPTLKELFIEQLENMILSGKLVIGEKLPSERELAESMHISRSVVNSGLAEISDKGFLEIIPRSGTYVADFHKKGKLDTLVSIMKFNGGNPSGRGHPLDTSDSQGANGACTGACDSQNYRRRNQAAVQMFRTAR